MPLSLPRDDKEDRGAGNQNLSCSQFARLIGSTIAGQPLHPDPPAPLRQRHSLKPPLVLRQHELVWFMSKQQGNGSYDGRTGGTSSGNVGFTDSQSARTGAYAWLGDFGAPAAGLSGGAAGATGIALSCAPSAGTPRLDQRTLGDERKQSARKILPADSSRTEATGNGNGGMAQAGGSSGPCS